MEINSDSSRVNPKPIRTQMLQFDENNIYPLICKSSEQTKQVPKISFRCTNAVHKYIVGRVLSSRLDATVNSTKCISSLNVSMFFFSIRFHRNKCVLRVCLFVSVVFKLAQCS